MRWVGEGGWGGILGGVRGDEVLTTGYDIRTTNCDVLTAYYLRLTTYQVRFSTYYLLLTTFDDYLLLTPLPPLGNGRKWQRATRQRRKKGKKDYYEFSDLAGLQS